MTKEQSTAKLIEMGLPDVYAVMAVEAPGFEWPHKETLAYTLGFAFTWKSTKQGHDFWSAVCVDAYDLGL